MDGDAHLGCPAPVLAHVAACAGLADASPDLAGYGDTTYRVRLATLVRGHVGVDAYDRKARGMAAWACIEAARTRDDLADIVNAGIEKLLHAPGNLSWLRSSQPGGHRANSNQPWAVPGLSAYA